MTPTLSEIESTPEVLRDYLISQNLSETYVETRSISNINYPIENTDEFVWSHIKTFMAFRGGYYNFKFNNLDLFYAIIFPNYSNSEIIQLTTVLTFIDKLFNMDKYKIPTNSCSITVVKPTVSADNSYFTIMQKSPNNYLFKTKHMEITVRSLSFEILYAAILVDLKLHIENYFGEELPIVDTVVFKSMLNETAKSYTDRLFINSVVKPITIDEFKESIEPVKFVIINDKIKLNKYDDAYCVNKEKINNIDSVDNKYGFSFFISLEKISVLKTILHKSMSSENIDLLIHNISMTAFYQNITMPNEKVTYIEFSRHEMGHMNKTELARKDYFYSITVGPVGRDMFTLGMELGINIIHAPHCIRAESMQDLYQQQFNKITSKICGILDTDCNNVTVADLQVIDMALF
jgi:hypothetical protein